MKDQQSRTDREFLEAHNWHRKSDWLRPDEAPRRTNKPDEEQKHNQGSSSQSQASNTKSPYFVLQNQKDDALCKNIARQIKKKFETKTVKKQGNFLKFKELWLNDLTVLMVAKKSIIDFGSSFSASSPEQSQLARDFFAHQLFASDKFRHIRITELHEKLSSTAVYNYCFAPEQLMVLDVNRFSSVQPAFKLEQFHRLIPHLAND